MRAQHLNSCIRLVQITDCHLQAQPEVKFKGYYPDLRLDAVLHSVQKITVAEGLFDHLLLSGDIAQSGAEQAYQRVLDKTLGIAQQRHWVPGNHDDVQLMSGFAQMQKKVTIDRDWAIILLDSTSQADGIGGGALSARELALLASVDQLSVKYVLLVLHHPPIEVGSRWQDAIKLANSDEFWRRIKALNKVRAISFGHLHQALHCCIEGIELFCTPATAPQFKVGQDEVTLEDDMELSKAGYRLLNLHGDGSITTEVVRVAALVPQG